MTKRGLQNPGDACRPASWGGHCGSVTWCSKKAFCNGLAATRISVFWLNTRERNKPLRNRLGHRNNGDSLQSSSFGETHSRTRRQQQSPGLVKLKLEELEVGKWLSSLGQKASCPGELQQVHVQLCRPSLGPLTQNPPVNDDLVRSEFQAKVLILWHVLSVYGHSGGGGTGTHEGPQWAGKQRSDASTSYLSANMSNCSPEENLTP